MKIEAIIIISILLSIILIKIQLPIIKRKNFGQQVREEGNQSHYVKNGTPTMGGIGFLIAFFVASIFFVNIDTNFIFIIISTIIFGLIGFIDDYEKVTKKQNLGLTENQKLLMQLAVSMFIITVFYFVLPINIGLVEIPFFKSVLNLGIFSIPIIVFIMVGTVNAVNFTDGIDGLLSSVSIPVLIGIYIISNKEFTSTSMLSLILASVLIGFLLFNSNPASIFMGDTGSMAIGGAIVSMLISINKPIYLAIIGGVYFIEALSVIIQRLYFKYTNGKRVFKMTPIHHHFELEGYSEPKVVILFTIASIIFTLITILII